MFAKEGGAFRRNQHRKVVSENFLDTTKSLVQNTVDKFNEQAEGRIAPPPACTLTVDQIALLGKDRILVRLKGGVEVEQALNGQEAAA